MLDPELWRNFYVVIPTVLPVATTNPRTFKENEIITSIIASENRVEEYRTLFGRVVSDRDCSLARMLCENVFVFVDAYLCAFDLFHEIFLSWRATVEKIQQI